MEGSMGTAKAKLDTLAQAGAHVAKTFTDLPRILKEVIN